MTSKYESLTNHLNKLPKSTIEIVLTYGQIEKILGFDLPKSAIDYRQWWENPSESSNRPQAQAWINARFKVDSVQLKKPGGWVRFRRM